MSAEADDVLAAIDEHSKSVGGSLSAMQKTIANLEKQSKEDRDCREELERKFNMARVLGAANDPAVVEAPALFSAAVKTWYPNRLRDDLPPDTYADYCKGFATYLRSGDRSIAPEHVKAMQIGIDPDGGYLAPMQFANEIIRLVREQTVIRPLARVIPTSTSGLEIPRQMTAVASGWVAETATRPATNGPTLGKITIAPHEWYAMPECTQQLLDDSVFAIDSFVNEGIAEQYAIDEDDAFLTGDGIARPRGILTYDVSTDGDATRTDGQLQYFPTGVAAALPATAAATYDLLIDVIHGMKPRLRRGAVWIGSTDTFAALAKLKDSQNRPLWVQSLTADTPSTLLGYPAHECELMPSIGAGEIPLMFANVKAGYWINDRQGIRLLRDPFTNKPFVRFYTTRRVGGSAVRFDAFKLVKIGAS